MAPDTFTHNSWHNKTLKMLIKMQRNVLKTSHLAYTMLLAQGQIYAKNMTFYVPIGCLRLARYCIKMHSCYLFLYGGLRAL